MARMTRFALRRSKLVVGAWVAVVLACTGLGVAADAQFAPANLFTPDSETERWTDLTADADFGETVTILLTGPRARLLDQGKRLAARLRGLDGVRVVSPYDDPKAGGIEQPKTPFTISKHDSALFAVDVSLPDGGDPTDGVAMVREVIDATVAAPVTAHVTGPAAIAEGITEELEKSVRRVELISAPILLLVLLLIFRSPVAAAIPLLLGLGSVQASKGIVELLATQVELDQMAVNMAATMALALGVDYSLLLTSRYRERRRRDPTAVHANVERASRATGRTIATAAVLVLAVMAVGGAMSIVTILESIAVGVSVATVFSAVTALVVAPALLGAVDPWLERWQLPSPRRRRGSRFTSRQPIAVPIVALLAMLAVAAPTLALAPGGPDIKLLPESNPARADYDMVGRVVGPGVGAMYDVAIRSRDGRPLTRRRTLEEVARLQRRIAADPDVAAAIGPGPLAALARPLNGLGSGLAKQADDVERLDRGLARAADGSARLGRGAARLRAGAGAAHDGAARLTGGALAAAEGSRQLADGIAAASDGGERLSSGSRQAGAGADRLSGALGRATEESKALSNSALVLSDDLRTGSDQLDALEPPVTTAEQRLDAAWQALQAMTSGRTDPQYQSTLAAVAAAMVAVTGTDPATGERPDPGYAGIAAGIDDANGQFDLGLYLASRMQRQGRQTQRGVERLASGGRRLDAGLARLGAGSAQLAGGLDRLAAASGRFPEGLGELARGAGALTGGLGKIEAGSGQIADRVGDAGAAGTLAGGLDQMHRALDRQLGGTQLGALVASSPNLLRSGSLPLAFASGMARPVRERTQFVLDLDQGGRGARILAVPAFATNDPRMGPLHDRLVALARDARGPDMDTAVGGPAASLQDFLDVISRRLPWMIAALALISFLVLMVAVRSIPLAAMCVVLNLLTVGVAFGVMQIAFGSSDPLLGGPGRVDMVSMFGALAVVFALSIDYQVFLLARIREEHLRSHDTDLAIGAAIGSTARVITGAAIVMVAIFIATATSSHIAVREVAVALAVAVFLDATVVRLILLPAAMRLAGERVWWFPSWLDRRVPNVSL
jgi:putative drug exporter of the RND superfamily